MLNHQVQKEYKNQFKMDTIEIKSSGAILSPCQKYRYKLWRFWNTSKKKVMFIMLNPSTATEYKDDRTVKRCINFAHSWGYGGIYIANLFAYRATKPADLWAAKKSGIDICGPQNLAYIEEIMRHSDLIILAWGMHGYKAVKEINEIQLLLGDKVPYCIEKTISSVPAHPLYLKSELTPIPY